MQKGILLTVMGGIALVLGMYFFGKIKKEEEKPVAETEMQNVFFEYEQLKMAEIPDADAVKVRSLKNALTLQTNANTYYSLSENWENIGNYPLGAYYYYKATEINSDSAKWEVAGDKLYNSYKNYADTLVTNNLLTFALASYETAIETNIKDLALQLKLAEVYVESPEPMKGIMMLRDIVDSIPNYTPAIMTLGRLSLQTGQYNKAVNRFSQVLEDNPVNTEAMYFLALAYEGLGNIEETIKLLETCKALVQIPEFSAEIDAYIKDLKK